jgi:hypothetical protein
MADLAQTYVHLRPYDVDVEDIRHLGAAAQEHAVAAAREIYRGNVTIDVTLEEGSAKLWVTVAGALTALHISYGIIADYKGFKESIVAICEDAREFGTFVSDRFLKDTAATSAQIYRVERRLKVPGKIRRVIAELERLENANLSEAELSVQLEAVQQMLARIGKELSPQEVAGLHQMLLHFENVKPLKESPPSRHRPRWPRVIIRPEQPAFTFGQQLTPYTESDHVWDADVDVPSFEKVRLTFHQTVFVPAVDGDDEKGKEKQPILI